MPLYPFVCMDCGYEEDLILSVKDWKVKKMKCPKCGGRWVRLVTKANFRMDGNKMGIYTDEGKFVEGHFER